MALNDDNVVTESSVLQQDVELDCGALLFSAPFQGEGVVARTLVAPRHNPASPTATRRKIDPGLQVSFLRRKHAAYLLKGLSRLSMGFTTLDASRPWLCYWILHSLSLLDALPEAKLPACAAFLGKCQHVTGGFGGGPLQLPHLAPTYAAVMALATIGGEALKIPVRPKLYRWLLSLKTPSGGFSMHHNGEIDVRGCYTAVATASLLNILTPELANGVADFITSCQTYEGGFGAFPGSEAHGGYTFCAVAALMILGEKTPVRFDVEKVFQWVLDRQMRFEGGYQGRINKLVDGCYSFWQGCVPALAHLEMHRRQHKHENGSAATSGPRPRFEARRLPCRGVALQRYILKCCQLPNGGLRDKPGKYRDYYHTCYCLSGLSVVQHFLMGQSQGPMKLESCSPTGEAFSETILGSTMSTEESKVAPDLPNCGEKEPEMIASDVANVNPWFNVRSDKCREALRFYYAQKCNHATFTAST